MKNEVKTVVKGKGAGWYSIWWEPNADQLEKDGFVQMREIVKLDANNYYDAEVETRENGADRAIYFSETPKTE